MGDNSGMPSCRSDCQFRPHPCACAAASGIPAAQRLRRSLTRHRGDFGSERKPDLAQNLRILCFARTNCAPDKIGLATTAAAERQPRRSPGTSRPETALTRPRAAAPTQAASRWAGHRSGRSRRMRSGPGAGTSSAGRNLRALVKQVLSPDHPVIQSSRLLRHAIGMGVPSPTTVQQGMFHGQRALVSVRRRRSVRRSAVYRPAASAAAVRQSLRCGSVRQKFLPQEGGVSAAAHPSTVRPRDD